MRKSTGGLLLSLLCVTTLLAAGFASRSKADENPAPPSLIRIHGTVNQTDEGRLTLTRQDGEMAGQEVVIQVSESAKVLDAVNGYPQTLNSLKSGDTVYAYVSPAMTLSLPPITNAELILGGIPAGFQVPDYVTVESVTVNGLNTGTIRTAEGTAYTVTGECQLLPYLTRNIITLKDLEKGQKCLIWTQAGSPDAQKIVAFANQAPAAGWTEEDGGWRYYGNGGSIHKGWLLDNGDWYYLNPDNGIMQTGFLTVDGKTYYLQSDGKMLTTSKTFTPDKNGAL